MGLGRGNAEPRAHMIDTHGGGRESRVRVKSRSTDRGTYEYAVPSHNRISPMKRLLIPLVTVAFLAFTAVAMAGTTEMWSKAGSAYGGASVTGTCKVSKVSLTTSAKVACGLAGGTAVIRYGFPALPASCGPTVQPTVDATGTNVSYSAATLSTGKIRVTVRVGGAAALAVISRVYIADYC